VIQVWFRFYAELNDCLPEQRRYVTFVHHCKLPASVKDMIESLGIPHTEVDVILVNGESVDFSYALRDGDRIAVYPVFESFDISPLVRLRPRPLRVTRFVLDVHLGRLASYLRMLGFDTLYRNDLSDQELARISRDERRILLTRDRGLLKRSEVTHGYWIRENQPRDQVVEVVRRFDLRGQLDLFQRCSRCNATLEQVDKKAVMHRIPPKTREACDDFAQCPACGQLYWEGTHTQRLRAFFDAVVQRAHTGPSTVELEGAGGRSR
jgi:uncharacterized protein with PIN domain